jgi:phage terminase large subunit-like protein
MSNDRWIERTEARKARSDANKAAHAKIQAEKLAAMQAEGVRRRGAMKAARAFEKAASRDNARMSPTLDPRLMTDAQLLAYLQAGLKAARYDWSSEARPEQLPPDNYRIWLLMAGRGFGKTRCAAEEARMVAVGTAGCRVAVIAKDHKQLRNVCFEGESGLIACIPPELVKKYKKGLGDVSLELTNGSIIIGYSASEPDAIRGESFALIWGDEFAAWPKNVAQDMLDQALMCLRTAKRARCILSTTPKRIPHVLSMVKLAEDPEQRIVITRGSSRDNPVLTEDWHRHMEKTYGGTRLGRQELDGELLLDNEHSLWAEEMIHAARWDAEDDEGDTLPFPNMVRVLTGVDPSGSSDGDATGIVTVGWDKHRVLYVLQNRTTKGAPAHRYSEVCRSAYQHGSAEIWYEGVYGGDNAAFGIAQQWKALIAQGEIPEGTKCPWIKKSSITGDKAARAMPVVALYEQQMNLPDRRRIWHPAPDEHNGINQLEDEQISWETTSKKSPNAIDALVHAVHQAMRQTGQVTTFSRPGSGRRAAAAAPAGTLGSPDQPGDVTDVKPKRRIGGGRVWIPGQR